MPNNYTTPISRNNLFYSENDFSFEMDIVQDYLEEDTNQTVVVYQVDRITTQLNDVYAEAHQQIHFLPPIEVPCLYEIQDAKLETYDTRTGRGMYTVHGNLTAYITLNSFKKYDFDIKRGDYIGIMIEENRMYYWTVTNDGKINIDNQKMVGAYKPGYRVINGAPITDNEIKNLLKQF